MTTICKFKSNYQSDDGSEIDLLFEANHNFLSESSVNSDIIMIDIVIKYQYLSQHIDTTNEYL